MSSTQPIEYTNRLGKTYYLFQGMTKKGNPRYIFSPKLMGGNPDWIPLDRIPEGFELFEHPNSSVVLRKKFATAVLAKELFYVREQVEELEREDKEMTKFHLEHIKDSLGFFFKKDPAEYLKHRYAWRFRAEVEKDSIVVYEVRDRTATAVLRFDLFDKESRRYHAFRWVFTGMGHWRPLNKDGRIENVAAEYCPHLTTDKFFELF